MSFKRRVQAESVQLPGTRPSPLASTVSTVSTGIPSLDDVLGGGLPLGSVLVLLAPDPNTAYAELVQRHFVAQGMASEQSICILDDSAMEFASGCMWVPSAYTPASQELEEEGEEDSGVKIAWRYENMKKFRTSVTHSESTEDAYCHPLDLTCRIPENVVNTAIASKKLRCLPVSSVNAIDSIATDLDDVLDEMEQTSSAVIRLCIPSLGSPQWGDISAPDILRFLHFLRARLRRGTPRTCAFVTLPSYVSQDEWGGPNWPQKLGWLSDGCITLRSFSSDLALSSTFPSHHGLMNIQTLPSPHTLISSSDKFSELRGLSMFSSSATGGGENNLGFKCTRKRFVIETVHLDVEGGVRERRTTALVMPDIEIPGRKSHESVHSIEISESKSSLPKKKKVTFQADNPDLYDF